MPLASDRVETGFHSASGRSSSLRLQDVQDPYHICRAKDRLKAQSWTTGLAGGLDQGFGWGFGEEIRWEQFGIRRWDGWGFRVIALHT